MLTVRRGERDELMNRRQLARALRRGELPPDRAVRDEAWPADEWRAARDVPALAALADDLAAPGWAPPAGSDRARVEAALLGLPWVTLLLVLANLLVYGALAALSRNVTPSVDALSLGWKHNLLIDAGQSWRLLACCFLHANLLHLGLNLWALWRVGGIVERLIGPAAFLVLYLSAGVAGAAVSYLAGPTATVGASGAVMGLLGAGLALGWRHRRRLPGWVARLLRREMPFWLLATLALGAWVPQVDNAAHLGGTAWGLAAGLLPDLHPLRGSAPTRRWLERLLAAAWLGAVVATTAVVVRASRPADDLVRRTVEPLGLSLRVPSTWVLRYTPGGATFTAPGVPAALRVEHVAAPPPPGTEADWLRRGAAGSTVTRGPERLRTALGQPLWHLSLWRGEVFDVYLWRSGAAAVQVTGQVRADRLSRYRPVFVRAAESLRSEP